MDNTMDDQDEFNLALANGAARIPISHTVADELGYALTLMDDNYQRERLTKLLNDHVRVFVHYPGCRPARLTACSKEARAIRGDAQLLDGKVHMPSQEDDEIMVTDKVRDKDRSKVEVIKWPNR